MPTYTLIASNTLGSSAASVTFSSIPNTYTDLILRISSRSDTAAVTGQVDIAFNGTSFATNSRTYIQGDGSAATSATFGSMNFRNVGASSTASTFANTEIYIPNYNVSQYKPVSLFSVTENNATNAFVVATAALRSDTAAVTSIYLQSNGTNGFVSGSSFFLYGIKNS